MTDYYCPAPLKEKFALAAIDKDLKGTGEAMAEHLEWIKSQPVKRGDRVEVINSKDEWVWWVHMPPTGKD